MIIEEKKEVLKQNTGCLIKAMPFIPLDVADG